MRANVSIRLRLTVWYSSVLLLGLALFAAGMWVALEHRLAAGVDTRLDQRVAGLRTVLDTGGGTMNRDQLLEELSEFRLAIPEGSFIELRDSTGALLLPAPEGGPVLGRVMPDRPVYSTESRSGRKFRVLQMRIQHGASSYYVLLASSLEDLQSVMRDFRKLLVIMIPALLAMACIGGYWISRRALVPVDDITRVARSISVENLSRRLPAPRTGDEIERMSDAWNDVLARLEASVNRIRQFTADASHELRTPLAFIRTTAELALRRERTAGEYRRSLLDIQNEVDRMTELTEALLTLARSDDAGVIPLAPTELNELVRDVVRRSEPAAGAKGILLRAATTERPAVAAANASAIRRLLLTLIDNALKHTPSGGTVTVSTAPVEGGVLLAVEDTGEGIEPCALPHIFERFFRADTARSGGDGTGLGLSIAQAIAQAHGSQVAVESEPGAGARFALVLRS